MKIKTVVISATCVAVAILVVQFIRYKTPEMIEAERRLEIAKQRVIESQKKADETDALIVKMAVEKHMKEKAEKERAEAALERARVRFGNSLADLERAP